MYGGAGSAGTASSIESASPASAPNMPTQIPFKPDINGIVDALSNMQLKAAQVDNIKSDTASKDISNTWSPKMFEQSYMNSKLSGVGIHLDNEGKALLNDYNKQTLRSRIDAVDYQNGLTQSQINLNIAQKAVTMLDAQSKEIRFGCEVSEYHDDAF